MSDSLELEVGFNYATDKTLSGMVSSNGTEIDVVEDLNLEKLGNNQGEGWINLKHFVPILPNIKIENSESHYYGESTLSKEITFLGFVFTISQDVISEMHMEKQDLTPYYNVLDLDLLSVDLGVSLRSLDGMIAVGDKVETIKEVIPMFYTEITSNPTDSLKLSGQVKYLNIDGDKIEEKKGTISYDIWKGLNIDVAYKSEEIDIEVDGSKIKIEEETSLVGLSYRF